MSLCLSDIEYQVSTTTDQRKETDLAAETSCPLEQRMTDKSK
jgi:hypothetical protein